MRCFSKAAIDAHAERIADDPAPRFLYVLTNYNHGPHDRRLAGSRESSAPSPWRACPDAGYAEYYARLAETASIWQRLRSELANNPGGPR